MASKVLTGFLGFFSSECYWFSLVGKLYGIYIAYRILSRLWYWSKLYFLSPTLQLAADVKSYGKWAVVTGATDGIGKSYAEQLAKKGMKVVLISRSADKLNNVAKEIAEKYGDVETKCVVADFTQDVSIYSKIQEEIKDLDIGVLVNNVGMSYEHPDYLDTMSDQDLKNIVAVNCFSVVFMSKMVLPKMTDKKKGLIINIASLSAHIACPFLTVYSATKAFVHRFSVSMEQEYKSKGINVQCVSPGFVATKLSKIKKYSFMAPGPDGFVSSALETVGLSSQVSGCFAHDLEKTFVDCAGDCCTNYLTYNIMSKVRAKGLAKKEKKN